MTYLYDLNTCWIKALILDQHRNKMSGCYINILLFNYHNVVYNMFKNMHVICYCGISS